MKIIILKLLIALCFLTNCKNDSATKKQNSISIDAKNNWLHSHILIRVNSSLSFTEWVDYIFSFPPHTVSFQYSKPNLDQLLKIKIPPGDYTRELLINTVTSEAGISYKWNTDNSGIVFK